MSEQLDGLRQRIKDMYVELSPALKKVAKIALDEPLEIALQPLRSLAARSGAGTTTFIRFARLLGFESYGSFRDCFRSDLRRGTSNYSERGRVLLGSNGADALVSEIRSAADDGLARSFASNPPAAMEAFADRLSRARRVYVVGLRSAYAPAFYLHYLLAMLRPDVRLIENRYGMLPEEIRGAGPDDVAVAISFEPYAQGTIETTRLLAEAGVAVLAISDSSASPLAVLAEAILEIATGSPSFYISFTPLTGVLEALAALVALRAGDQGLAALKQGDDVRAQPGVYWSEGRPRKRSTGSELPTIGRGRQVGQGRP